MDLDFALNSVRPLSLPVLPKLTRLIAAKKRVLNRWPDIVSDPPEADKEVIIAQMLALLQNNSWEDTKMSFVLRAFKVAFDSKFRTRDDVSPIIEHAFDELKATTRPTFLNGMVAIYFSSYEPEAYHSLELGRRITAKRHLLKSKWLAIEKTYPFLFDASRAHRDIVASMENMDEPWQGLKANGFSNPHATGLMDHVHIAYVDMIRPKLHMKKWLDILFKWLNPEAGKRKITNSINVIEAVLGHWIGKSVPDQALRQAITEYLINQYNDPRTNESLWMGVAEDHRKVIFRWLTGEDLRFFTAIVDATQKEVKQWETRKEFWLKLYDKGKIDAVWVAFCPSAECRARELLTRDGFTAKDGRFGKQSKGGARSNTSILLMQIGKKIVVDGCHDYKTHIFNIDDPMAPKLFKPEYDCDADVRHRSPSSKSHHSIFDWKQWVMYSIDSNTPMYKKKS
ncbi:MAG: hypothetical protein IT544_01100 [Rhodobacteraceae bacterium]|nr:hypothetical protein [Paracoccaceae bacterium]